MLVLIFSCFVNVKMAENKKAWEIYFRAHPSIQAFALPLHKDKQRSQPTPSDYM